MSEGQKYDQDKTRLDLIPVELIEGVGRVLTYGAKKYAPRNWEKGIAYGRAFGATLRHLFAWWGGERFDKESGYHHLWHAATELSFLIAYEERGMTQLDDRPSTKQRNLMAGNIKAYQEDYDVITTLAGQCDPRPNGGAA